MGRRSITGTKAGKFMNPTDQARKEARRKELKKNKKQRLQVRQAVIKQKDPKIIFAEMEAIDKMEYDPNNPPPYSVKVLQDKRRKLKETWMKIYQYYQREDPKQAHEIKVMELDYERRRNQMMTTYESIMQAQRVKLDDIPLPEFSMPPPAPPDGPSDIELSSLSNEPKPVNESTAPKSILKSKPLPTLVSSCYDTEKQPPGAPSGAPPSLSEFECDEDEFELGLTIEDTYKSQEKPKKIRFDTSQTVDSSKQQIPQVIGQMVPPHPPVTAATIQQSLLAKSYSNLNRVPPPQMQTGGYPSRSGVQPVQQKPNQQFYQQQGKSATSSEPIKQTTIQAQPVLRNKIAEITRFVPTSLSVKRDTKKPTPIPSQPFANSQSMSNQTGGPFNYMLQQQQQYATLNPLNFQKSALAGSSPKKVTPPVSSMSTKQSISIVAAPSVQHVNEKDAAYEKFMKEMEGLL